MCVSTRITCFGKSPFSHSKKYCSAYQAGLQMILPQSEQDGRLLPSRNQGGTREAKQDRRTVVRESGRRKGGEGKERLSFGLKASSGENDAFPSQ